MPIFFFTVPIVIIIIVSIIIKFQLFEALIDFGENWDDHSLALLAGGNLLRVLRQVDLDHSRGSLLDPLNVNNDDF